jgi:hypothetical protein
MNLPSPAEQIASNRGLHRPFWTADKVERLRVLWAEGHSARVIAAEFPGASRNAVLGAVHREKLPKRITYISSARKTYVRQKAAVRKYAPSQRPPVLEEIPIPDASKQVAFMELKPQHCRYPYGESNFLFCGSQKQKGSSYCQYHHVRLNYKPKKENKALPNLRVTKFGRAA